MFFLKDKPIHFHVIVIESELVEPLNKTNSSMKVKTPLSIQFLSVSKIRF